MILVTVGTTMTFDALIEKIDELAESNFFNEKVICQIGNGNYLPHTCEYFRFRPSLDELIDQASLIICHGGTGSVLSMLAKEKRFIAVANPKGADEHQQQFLHRLSQVTPLLWTSNLNELLSLITASNNFKNDAVALPCLADDLREYIMKI